MSEQLPVPRGTVTFHFTDLEGSTWLWQVHPEPMQRVYVRHHAFLWVAIHQQ